jgi:hypothetical protein
LWRNCRAIKVDDGGGDRRDLGGIIRGHFGRAAHTKASQLTFGFVTFFLRPRAFVWGFSRKGEGPVERRDLRFWG